jgi:hypothetical protein
MSESDRCGRVDRCWQTAPSVTEQQRGHPIAGVAALPRLAAGNPTAVANTLLAIRATPAAPRTPPESERVASPMPVACCSFFEHREVPLRATVRGEMSGRYLSTIPLWNAITTSCTRSRAPSFINILDTWVLAVSGLR